MSSPTQRTLDLFRDDGFDVAVVEKYVTIPGRKFGVRRDAFGFIDILAFNSWNVTAIQATSTSNMQARVNKILESDVAFRWLSDGNGTRLIVVVGWKKYAKPKDRKWWRHTTRYIMLEDFDEARRQQSRQPAAVS